MYIRFVFSYQCASKGDGTWLKTNVLFFAGAVAVSSGGFGPGEGPVFLASVHCFGVEGSLLDCPNSGIDAHNLPHFKDAGVVCLGTIDDVTHIP